MYAYIRLEGGFRSHTWPADKEAKQTDDGVVIDGYLIDGAELERVESDRGYFGDEVYECHFEQDDSILSTIAGALGWS